MKTFRIAMLVIFTLACSASVYAGSITGKVQVTGKTDFQNILVYVEEIKGQFPLPKRRPEMNHLNLQFVPNKLAVMKGTTVDFPNSDPVLHSAFSISKANPFELGIYGRGFEKFVHFQNSGVTEIFCHIHSHMHAFVMVLDNPFFAATASDGSFTINDLPDGTYRVKAWMDPSLNDTKTVTVNGSVPLDFTLAAKN